MTRLKFSIFSVVALTLSLISGSADDVFGMQRGDRDFHHHGGRKTYSALYGLRKARTHDARQFLKGIEDRAKEYHGKRIRDKYSKNFDLVTKTFNKTIRLLNKGGQGRYRKIDIYHCPTLKVSRKKGHKKMKVSKLGCFEVAEDLHDKGFRNICCLNCADAKKKLGGVLNGRTGQEENEGARSTLAASVFNKKCDKVYKNGSMNHGTCLYSPHVMVYGEDKSFDVSILSSAAVDNREPKDSTARSMQDRADDIFKTAASAGAESVVLAAYGCKIFRNDPRKVGRYFKYAYDRYGGHFKNVIVALPDDQVRAEFERGLNTHRKQAAHHHKHRQHRHAAPTLMKQQTAHYHKHHQHVHVAPTLTKQQAVHYHKHRQHRHAAPTLMKQQTAHYHKRRQHAHVAPALTKQQTAHHHKRRQHAHVGPTLTKQQTAHYHKRRQRAHVAPALTKQHAHHPERCWNTYAAKTPRKKVNVHHNDHSHHHNSRSNQKKVRY